MIEMFDKNGNIINSGFYDSFILNYQRNKVKARESKIKEWDFYQFNVGDFIFQVTVAHALLFDNFYVGIFNIRTGERYYNSLLYPHNKKKMILIDNPEKDYNNEYHKKDFNLIIKRVGLKNTILFNGIMNKKYPMEAKLEFDSVDKTNKFLILHPFEESNKMFYFNYKENYFNANVIIKVNDININSIGFGTLDLGRGYWPFNSMWYWGNHSFISNNNKIGWNLGYGFGICKDSENVLYFNDNKIKLNKLISTIDIKNPMAPYDIKDDNDIINIHLEPIYDNYSETKLLWVRKWCHQVYHKTTGYIKINEKKQEINTISFFEFEENHW